MSKTLVIVESPTKARTIKKFLGANFDVQSSFGHIRDLPKSKLGVDVANGFTPEYVIPPDSKKQVAALKKAAKDADDVILASDEDREGEAIAWHVAQALNLAPERAKRIVFHEITKSAIEHALAHPRTLDMQLVDAQQARRILDRLVGYTLSPLLWRKVGPGLSAGRVQSVAVRLIVDREREVKAFQPEEYWTVDADLLSPAAPGARGAAFTASLKQKDGTKYVPHTQADADAVAAACTDAAWRVMTVEEKEITRKPAPPFTTSTLQQEASRKLGFGVKQTMMFAQRLYETGHITYMRTDSVSLAAEAVAAITQQIGVQFGKEYVLAAPRTFTAKAKGAQEAHEAIRPTSTAHTPADLPVDDEKQRALYELIWMRTMACQMPDAKLKRVGADVEAQPSPASRGGAGGDASKRYTFRATGQTVLFDGFLRAYQEGRDEEHEHGTDREDADGEKFLPPLTQGDACELQALRPEQHFTKPPPRYTEASLVKKLEEEGIGRPSTYAPTISTIQARGYVERDGKQLVPTDVAFMVIDLLTEHFPTIVDLAFTAKMEEDLDSIAEGTRDDKEFLRSFWEPFSREVAEKQEDLTKADVSQERVVGKDSESGLEVLVRLGRFGPYVQLGHLEDMPMLPPKPLKSGKPSKAKPKRQKPKSSSLLKGQDRDALTLEQALALLSFPRTLGEQTGEPIIINLGRFGPYIKCGAVNASVPADEDPTAITLDRALVICAEAAERKKKMAEPLRTLGDDPESTKPIVIKEGRFGAYVTDGTTHASIPKKSSVEAITLEEALTLLTKKRARGPGRRWGKKK
ncbi:MAG: type I DNA topoisomerase [bacterium]|nr:type I DNA topoisomerase [bacterium]